MKNQSKIIILRGNSGSGKTTIAHLLQEYFKDELSIYRSEPFFLEIMPPLIDKAKSLEKLLRYLDCSRKEMVACGDGLNDLTMIEYAVFNDCLIF